jgi:hypothetical protein
MDKIMNRYHRREKKHSQPIVIGDIKHVRIDRRTIIEVSVNIPDDIAMERYIKRYKLGNKIPEEFMPPKEEIIPHEEAVGSLEELEAIIEDANIVETD